MAKRHKNKGKTRLPHIQNQNDNPAVATASVSPTPSASNKKGKRKNKAYGAWLRNSLINQLPNEILQQIFLLVLSQEKIEPTHLGEVSKRFHQLIQNDRKLSLIMRVRLFQAFQSHAIQAFEKAIKACDKRHQIAYFIGNQNNLFRDNHTNRMIYHIMPGLPIIMILGTVLYGSYYHLWGSKNCRDEVWEEAINKANDYIYNVLRQTRVITNDDYRYLLGEHRERYIKELCDEAYATVEHYITLLVLIAMPLLLIAANFRQIDNNYRNQEMNDYLLNDLKPLVNQFHYFIPHGIVDIINRFNDAEELAKYYQHTFNSKLSPDKIFNELFPLYIKDAKTRIDALNSYLNSPVFFAKHPQGMDRKALKKEWGRSLPVFGLYNYTIRINNHWKQHTPNHLSLFENPRVTINAQRSTKTTHSNQNLNKHSFKKRG